MGDRETVSQEKHELAHVLRKHGKSGNADNVVKLRSILKEFKAGRKDTSRAEFYEHLKNHAEFGELE
ncbi:MAG: hypothetical protein KKG60_03915 [Nanoarchaeota archaeon]|nr:hypothetical protein [Nanoarchaeota archaeon]